MMRKAKEIQDKLPLLHRPLNVARITRENYQTFRNDIVSMAFLSPHTRVLPVHVDGDGETET